MTDPATSEYRLSWESCHFLFAAEAEARYGKDCWPRIWDKIPEPWLPTQRIASGGDILGQYHTLLRWAESHEQPIRNVQLEQRVRPDPETGWEPA